MYGQTVGYVVNALVDRTEALVASIWSIFKFDHLEIDKLNLHSRVPRGHVFCLRRDLERKGCMFHSNPLLRHYIEFEIVVTSSENFVFIK